MTFGWKKKTCIYIGRFQPFHDGHKALFLKALKKYKQVCFLVMDSHGLDNKNPYSFLKVSRIIHSNLKGYKKKYKIIKIPPIKSLVYGRKVGYKIERIKLKKNIEKISATNIRKKLYK